MTGTRDREAEKAAREAAWWKRWWAEDFSWNGLRERREGGAPKKPWAGWSVTPDRQCVETRLAPDRSRPATLQDYFCWNPDTKRMRTAAELIEDGLLVQNPSQPRFHILHLPQFYRDGTPTFKAAPDAEAWSTLETEVACLLSRSTHTNNAIGQRDCPSADFRAQLSGACLRHFPRPDTSSGDASLHLAAKFATFLKQAEADNLRFGSPTALAQTLFCNNANFSNAEFSGGDADFSGAEFSGWEANFTDTVFSGQFTTFLDAKFFGRSTRFTRTKFSSKLSHFCGAKFIGDSASFAGASFSGEEVDFMGAEFFTRNAHFYGAEFSGRVAGFQVAKFCGGHATFSRASFSVGQVDFTGAKFSGGIADFSSAEFSGKDARFQNAEFSGGGANFRNTKFSGAEANFIDAHFLKGVAEFGSARFFQTCMFGQSDQPRNLPPTPGAQFLERFSFRGAHFKGPADFSRVRFPDKAEDRNSAFEGARFFEPLDLKGVERLPFSAFHGVRLDKGLLLDSQHPVPDHFRQALSDTEAALTRDKERDPEQPAPDAERSGADKRYAALEAGCRALKEAMAADGDRKREQSFFSHELAARERRVRHRLEELKTRVTGLRSWLKACSVRAELTASQAYKLFSGYGGSILRPLVTLLASFPLVAATLGFLTCAFALAGNAQLSDVCFGLECGPTMHPIVSNTLEAAFRGMLGPFRLLLGRGEPFAYLGDTAPVFRGLVALVMLLHGLVSSALIFLGLLALRRQFQIN